MRFVREVHLSASAKYWLLFQSMLLLPLTALGLRLFGFERVLAELDRLARLLRQAPPNHEAAHIERVWHAIRYIARYGPYRGNCLSRSLVLWWLLRRRGIDSKLRIGTRKWDGQFQAHAWVEYEDRPVNAGPGIRHCYATFDLAFTPEILPGIARE